eukprot:490799-Pyramimonas_sp.AAC.1
MGQFITCRILATLMLLVSPLTHHSPSTSAYIGAVVTIFRSVDQLDNRPNSSKQMLVEGRFSTYTTWGLWRFETASGGQDPRIHCSRRQLAPDDPCRRAGGLQLQRRAAG